MGSSGDSIVEATAPACVDLLGGGFARGFGPEEATAAVTVAIDRRALCRVETGISGLHVESKDAPFRALVQDADELLAAGCPPLVAAVLRRLGVDSGLKVTFQSRAPAGSGLGEEALAVAVSAAVTKAIGGDPAPDEMSGVAHEVLASIRGEGAHRIPAAIGGGAWACRLEAGAARADRLQVDPGRVEEALLLVDTGVLAAAETPRTGDPVPAGGAGERAVLAHEAELALAGDRYGDVAELIAREWAMRKRLDPAVGTPEAERVVEIARIAGGAARACGGGAAGWMLVWALPGERGAGSRERVERDLRAAGLRIVPFRVDLRGLEVD